jgi:FAD/FMN-containing dehydrogenase
VAAARVDLAGPEESEVSSLKHDISVPVAAIPEFVATTCAAPWSECVPGIRPCVFGHVGDGNLHFNLSQPETMTAGRISRL